MLLNFPHVIEFTNLDDVSVADVARSLQANEELSKLVGPVLEQCFPGLKIDRITIKFVSASFNTPLKEALSAGILLTFQDDLKREVPALIQQVTGVTLDSKYTTLVTVIFLIIVVYGIDMAWNIFRRPRSDGKPPYAITNNYGTIINAGGELLGIPPDQLAAAVKKSLPTGKRVSIVKSALEFIRPAQRSKGSAIRGATLEISAATIEQAPTLTDITLGDEDAIFDPHDNVDVVIHATDLDHSASGWAGHIPSICEKRTRIKLSPSISPASLFGVAKVNADVIIINKLKDDGTYTPSVIHLINTHI